MGNAVIIPKKYADMFSMEDGKYLLTAYFTDPVSICSNAKTLPGCVGDQLYIQTGATPQKLYKVPLLESAMPHTNWTRGKCFYQMGRQWYLSVTDTKCKFIFYKGVQCPQWAVQNDSCCVF